MIIVHAKPGEANGTLSFKGCEYPCALGRSGIVRADVKCEGDGATPAGVWDLRKLHVRADRLAPPPCSLPTRIIEEQDGWCDAPDDPAYNRPVTLPHPTSTEALMREDELYNLIVELGYNDAPPVPGKGSAIFFHVAKRDGDKLKPTEGCVALKQEDLLKVLKDVRADTKMQIELTGA